MGIARLAEITQALLGHGKDPDTPAAAIRWGTTGDQRTVEAPLGGLAAAVRAANLTAPALVIIGAVAGLRPQLAWFEQGLLDAQAQGITWKFVAVSSPIDQIGPIGGSFTIDNSADPAAPAFSTAESDGGKAHRAVWALARAPGQSLPFLKERARAFTAPDPGRVERLLADLDSRRGAIREQASRELEVLGDAVPMEVVPS